jgi:hypothetical protein
MTAVKLTNLVVPVKLFYLHGRTDIPSSGTEKTGTAPYF